ncbi:PREDICTED: anaphase-promoting complex subunit 11-like [Amphimedon queenslandica]|uniref:Anaphase-promoting complex subunit 11 n=1 Tax=Amphimedon queenslandica TaxID=400682 RepID=A0A1X7TU40_AMPQE|nr:PREDICTED: anaphase-promoting complex subunit 11-like [Amphimedon queenslandica]|eukprot:XP_019857700.1 PREDICTED: anaphase-promoting complex subunit 11-like [Amphimedon queenslandica]
MSTGLKVKIKSWNGVGFWKWMTNDTDCGICRLPFDGCCPDCRIPGDDCPIVSGQCRHQFHMHCILKWLQTQQMKQQCPMCRRDWQFSD